MTTLYDPRRERWPQVSLKGLVALVMAILYVIDPELGLVDLIVWFGNRQNRKLRDDAP